MTDLSPSNTRFTNQLRRALGVKDQPLWELDGKIVPSATIIDTTRDDYWHVSKEFGFVAGGSVAAVAAQQSGMTLKFTNALLLPKQIVVIQHMIIGMSVAGAVSFGVIKAANPQPFPGTTNPYMFDTRDGFQGGNALQLNFGAAAVPGYTVPAFLRLPTNGQIELLRPLCVFGPDSSFGILTQGVNTTLEFTVIGQIIDIEQAEIS